MRTNDMTGQLTAIAAELIADQGGMTTDGPEAQIPASALIGLWRVQRLAQAAASRAYAWPPPLKR
jgi:hypothetical protein